MKRNKKSRIVTILVAVLMAFTIMPLGTSKAEAAPYYRVYLHAYDSTTGEIFTEGITWYLREGTGLVKKDNYTFEAGHDYFFRAFLPDDSPYVAVEWREGDPKTGNVVGTVSDWSQARMLLSDVHYYLILEPKCPKGGRHEWTKVIRKATLTEWGGEFIQCSKCLADEMYSSTAPVENIELRQTEYTYDGEAKQPEVFVTDVNEAVVIPLFYDVSYTDNVNAGTAKATVTFNTFYDIEQELYFKINPILVEEPTGITEFKYNGKAQTSLEAGEYYTVTGNKATNAGTYTAKAILKDKINYRWNDGSTADKSIKWAISKAANTLNAKGLTATVKYTKLKKTAQKLSRSKVIKLVNAGKGTKTYTKASGNAKITIAKTTGNVTVKKGLKKGTYKVKVKVKAAGTTNYKPFTKTVTLTIKVK